MKKSLFNFDALYPGVIVRPVFIAHSRNLDYSC
jgi:hypothetical protein